MRNILRRSTSRKLRLTLFALCLHQISCGQASQPSLDKAQVLKTVKVQSVADWKEVISDTGRFRILFPDEPEKSDKSIGDFTEQGYKLHSGETFWMAYYSDFQRPIVGEAALRDAYQKSAAGLTGKGSKLLRQNDIILNGRLGTEMILKARNTVFMRGFLIGRRMYVLEVDRPDVPDGDSTIPDDVRQFFDSFTFWE